MLNISRVVPEEGNIAQAPLEGDAGATVTETEANPIKEAAGVVLKDLHT
jgi:hypothetical protein